MNLPAFMTYAIIQPVKGSNMRQVILIPDEAGGYVVEVPSLPDCYSQGETEAEAMANIKEAIELHIESMIAAGEEVPDDVPAPILLKASRYPLKKVVISPCTAIIRQPEPPSQSWHTQTRYAI